MVSVGGNAEQGELNIRLNAAMRKHKGCKPLTHNTQQALWVNELHSILIRKEDAAMLQNKEGYVDPTAYQAIKNIEAEERKHPQVFRLAWTRKEGRINKDAAQSMVKAEE